MLIFILVKLLLSPGHISLCWYSTWSCIPVLIFSLGNVWLADIYTCAWILILIFSIGCFPMLIFTFGHISQFWKSRLVIYSTLDIYTCSCIPLLIFTLGYVLLCWYSNLNMYHAVHILTWKYSPVLVFTLGYGSPVAILTWLCIPVFYSPLVMCPYFHIHVSLC